MKCETCRPFPSVSSSTDTNRCNARCATGDEFRKAINNNSLKCEKTSCIFIKTNKIENGSSIFPCKDAACGFGNAIKEIIASR